MVCYPYPLKVYDGQAKSDRRLIRPSLLYGRRECSIEVNKYSARGDTNAFLVLLSQNIFTQYNLKLGCKSVNKLQNYSSFYFSVCVTPRKTSHPLRISTENSCNWHRGYRVIARKRKMANLQLPLNQDHEGKNMNFSKY